MRLLFLYIFLFMLMGCNLHSHQKNQAQNYTNKALADSLLNISDWTILNYEAGVKYLKQVSACGRTIFTNYIKTDGKLLFERITDTAHYNGISLIQTFAFQTDTAIRLTNSIIELSELLPDSLDSNHVLIMSSEIVRCQIASLKLTKNNVDLLSLDLAKKVSLTQKERDAIIKMRHGVYSTISAALETIKSKYMYYNKKDILLLTNFISTYINNLASFLGKEYMQILNDETERVLQSNTYPEVKSQLKPVVI